MGLLTGRNEAGSQKENPVRTTLTWNAQKGACFYNNPETEQQFEATEWRGVIVFPNAYCVTGKDRNGAKITSNLSIHGGEYDYVKIYRNFIVQTPTGNQRKGEVLATGQWRKLKENVEVVAAQAKFTRCTIVWLTYVKGVDLKTGEAIELRPKELAQFRTKGKGMEEAWDAPLAEINFDYRNSDGLFVTCKGNKEGANSNGTVFLYPVLKLQEPDMQKEDHKLLVAQCVQQHSIVSTYLKTPRDTEEYIEDELTAEAERIAAQSQQVVNSAPAASDPASTATAVPEEDLPF